MTFPFRKQLALCYHCFQLAHKYPNLSLTKRISIMVDYYRLYNQKRLLVSEYYEYEFEKCSEHFRETFLGMAEQGYYLKTLNPIKYYSLARNKYLTHLYLDNLGIPMPKLLGHYNPYEIGSDVNFAKQLIRVHQNRKEPFVIKATESSHGEGVYVVESINIINEDIILNLINGKKVSLKDVLKHKEELIIESLIKQTNQFSNFNNTSVNTIRFMTTLYPNGKAKIIATFIKIGRNGFYVDNAGMGGNIDANINIETGEINQVVEFKGFRNTRKVEIHPDSKSQLEGTIIENWENIKSKIISFQESLPFVKAAGWDIAITDDGPVVIEVNDSWDRTGQLFIKKGWRNEIKECFKEWDKIGYNPSVERGTNNLPISILNEYRKLFN